MSKEKISHKLKFIKEVTKLIDKENSNKIIPLSLKNMADKYSEIMNDLNSNYNEKDITRKFLRYSSGKYDKWNQKKDKRKNDSIEEFSKFFNTSSEHLIHDNNYIKVIKTRMRLEGIDYIALGSDLLEFDNSCDEFEYELEKIEREGLIESIIKECDKLEILDYYKFLIFYNDYRKINNEAWSVIYTYSLLDEKEKNEFERDLFSKNIFKMRKIEKTCINKIDIELLGEVCRRARSKDENKIRKYLENQLRKKLNSDNTERIEFLEGIIEELLTLDLKDWRLIEHYYSLSHIDQREISEKCYIVIEKSNLSQ